MLPFAADANDPNLVVPVVCADGNTNQKYEQCAKPCENVNVDSTIGQCTDYMCADSIYVYTSTNSFNLSFSQECKGNECYGNSNILRNAVINKCKASCDVFKNQCSSYVVRIMDLMSAMPEIGISRVDPNLIEY